MDKIRINIKAYPLNGNAATLQPASRERAWLDENGHAAHLGCDIANGQGWNVLCPCAFEATWNGGPNIEDIKIRVDKLEKGIPAFVQSQLGGGILTLHTGYQIKPDAGYRLWIRGPINEPKDGISPLESIADTSILPCTISINWKFTRPHQAVRFEAGEAFCALLPFPKQDFDNVGVDVMQIGEDVERYQQNLQEMTDSAVFHHLLRRMGATIADSRELLPNISIWAHRLHNPPAVSCICPASERIDLLEEAIYGFLQQDYPGEKELIVLNDWEGQTLACDHPNVYVVNLPRRFHSMGEKFTGISIGIRFYKHPTWAGGQTCPSTNIFADSCGAIMSDHMTIFQNNLYDLAHNLATRYNGKVAFWIIWNEPNLANEFSPQDSNLGGGFDWRVH
ncbi:MAG TPA: DUF6065 family protein [Candidatus Angelobacter sp.]